MKYQGELIFDANIINCERDFDNMKHEDIAAKVVDEDVVVNFQAKDLKNAIKTARRIAKQNNTNSIIMGFKDDKYDYSMMIFADEVTVGNVIIGLVDGGDSGIEIGDYNYTKDDIEEMVQKELQKWA